MGPQDAWVSDPRSGASLACAHQRAPREAVPSLVERIWREDCGAVEMGKFLSVKNMITGNVGKLGHQYVLSVRVTDAQTGEIQNNSSKRIVGKIENAANDLGDD